MAKVTVDVEFKAAGSQTGLKTTKAIATSIAGARADIDGIKKAKGIGALAIGESNVNLAAAEVENLAVQLIRAGDAAEEAQREFAAAVTRGDAGQMSKYAADVAQAESNVAGLTKQLNSLGRETRESSRQNVGFLGDIDTGLQTLGTTAVNLGGQIQGTQAGGLAFAGGQFAEAGGTIGRVGDIFAVAEQLPNIANALGELDQVAGAAVNSLGGVWESLQVASKVSIATGGAIGLLVVGLGFLAAGALESKRAAEEQFEAERERIRIVQEVKNEIEGLTDAERELQRIDLQGAVDTIAGNIDDFENQMRDAAGIVATEEEQLIKNLVAMTGEAFDDIATIDIDTAEIEELIAFMNEVGATRGVSDAVRDATTSFNALKSNAGDTKTELDNATAALRSFESAVDDIGATSINIAQQISDLSAEMESFSQGVQASLSGSTDQTLAQEQALQIQIAAQQEYIDQLGIMSDESIGAAQGLRAAQQELDGMEGSLADFEKLAGSAGITDSLRRLVVQQQEYVNSLEATVEGSGRVSAELVQAQEELTGLERSLGTLQSTTRPLIGLREREEKAVRDSVASTEARIEVERGYAQLQDSITESIADNAATIAGIETDLDKTVSGLDDKFDANEIKRKAKHGKALAALDTQSATKITAINSSFMEKSVKLNADFLKDTISAEKESNAERVRILQDAGRELLNAEEDNDVKAFIRAGANRDLALSQQATAATAESQEQLASFNAQNVTLKQNRAKQLGDLKTDVDNRREILIQSYDEQSMELEAALEKQKSQAIQAANERIENEREALRTSIADQKAAHQASLEQQAAANKQRLALERQLTDGLAQAALSSYNRAIASIQTGTLQRSAPASQSLNLTKFAPVNKTTASTQIVNITANVDSGMSEAAVRDKLNRVAFGILGGLSQSNPVFNSTSDRRR